MEESTCKFCKANTLFNKVTDRMYDSDGVTFHVDSCPTAKEHYKKEALERDARKRSRRLSEDLDPPSRLPKRKRRFSKEDSYERGLYDEEHLENFGLRPNDNSYNAGCSDDV
jgi:hypothetical protein